MDELDLEIRRGDQNFDDAEKWKRRAESAEKQLAEARRQAFQRAAVIAHLHDSPKIAAAIWREVEEKA